MRRLQPFACSTFRMISLSSPRVAALVISFREIGLARSISGTIPVGGNRNQIRGQRLFVAHQNVTANQVLQLANVPGQLYRCIMRMISRESGFGSMR